MGSHINQKHLDLIARVYDLPLRPEGWPAVLDEFMLIMNAAMAATAVYDPRYAPHHLNTVSSNLGPSFLEEQRRFTSNGYQSAFTSMMEKPKRVFVADMDMLGLDDIEQYAQRPMIQWLKQKYKIFHGAASCLNLDRAWSDILFVMFSDERGPITDQEMKIGNFYLNHFAKSNELGRTFSVLKDRFNGVFTALDRFHIGIFVLSPNGSMVIKNAEAERIIDAGDGLSISREGQLHPRDREQRAELKDAIARAAGTAEGQDNCAESLMTVSRSSHRDSYLVEVTPIRDKDEIEAQFSGCLVFVIDPTKTDVVSTDGMQALYSLTNSESEVCKLLAEGFATDDIADARNLTRDTVRNYVKQVLRKTKTSNRSQLVRLALNVNLPIDPVSREE